MLRALAILFVSLAACTAGQAQKANDEIRLRATVQSVVQLADFSGAVIPVHFDPGFALTVRIESATPPVAGFASGSLVTFAIHSPSLLFVGEPTKGKTYDFVLDRKTESGKVRFSDLKLQALAHKMR
jgi:hypothetical protein